MKYIHSNTTRSGFTLAEMVVVLVIVGLMMSIVLPRLAGVGDKEKLRDAVRRMASLAVEANSEAATKARPWFLCVDLDRQRMWLATVRPGKEGDTGRESRYFNLPSGVKLLDVIHPSSGMLREGRVAFGYWPQGGSEPGTAHFKNEDGDEMTVFLRPFLGRTEIEEGYLREDSS